MFAEGWVVYPRRGGPWELGTSLDLLSLLLVDLGRSWKTSCRDTDGVAGWTVEPRSLCLARDCCADPGNPLDQQSAGTQGELPDGPSNPAHCACPLLLCCSRQPIVSGQTRGISRALGFRTSLRNKANLRNLTAATGLVILLKIGIKSSIFCPCNLEIWWIA